MPAATQQYKIGHNNKIYRLPQIKAAEGLYSERISTIRQVLEGSEAEVDSSWPGVYFKDVVDQVMIASDVVKQSSGKSHNPNRRLMVEQNALG